jgi:hypothetical protein
MARSDISGRYFSSIASSVAAALLLGAVAVGACGGDDTGTPVDAGNPETIKLLCETFTTSGTPCSPISDQRCFAMCATGGCKCVAGPTGSGVWACTVDESCYPGIPDLDAATDDSSTTDPDATTSTDAGTDAIADASTDAIADAADAGD